MLRSNENFLKAQDEVVGTENRIAVARKDYNDATQDYNTTRATFPTVISAKLYGFKEEPYFKAEVVLEIMQPRRLSAQLCQPLNRLFALHSGRHDDFVKIIAVRNFIPLFIPPVPLYTVETDL